ncbi:TlpA family protein disulfide reductase [Nocardioides rubriscoriae]|uniref:TlpA family protein disulfide reductase n=1 Tax=Nocardioides rubriscoriae TaxID=642762 RepID=UPI001479018F|nr:TlpA disulfide reductase family protein [Nocardioides rubriscoriae]
MRRVLAGLAALTAGLVLLSGCDGAVPSPGPSKVDVDTPALREQKAAAGIEDCVPGSGTSDLPALTLPCLGGGPDVDLSTLKGPMLINLWYSGCGPCRREMPVLQQFHDTYADQVPIVGIDIETYPDYAISFADEVGATYPQLADPGGTIFDDAGLRLAQAFPQTIYLAEDGSVAAIEAKEIKSLDALVRSVQTNLGVTL